MRRLLVVASILVAALTVSGVGSADPTREVKVSFACDKGIYRAAAQVWLLPTPVADYSALATENVGTASLTCGQDEPSFHARAEIVPSAPFSYMHVAFGAAACGPFTCRYLCIVVWPGLGSLATLPVKESCTVFNEHKNKTTATLTVR